MCVCVCVCVCERERERERERGNSTCQVKLSSCVGLDIEGNVCTHSTYQTNQKFTFYPLSLVYFSSLYLTFVSAFVSLAITQDQG